MKKVLYLVGFLILICFGVLISLSSIVKGGIEKYGSQIAGVPISIGYVKISPFNGSGSLSNFKVANPRGFKASQAMQFKKISFKVNLQSLFDDKLVINYIRIINPEITFEGLSGNNNINQIKKNIALYGINDSGEAKHNPAIATDCLQSNDCINEVSASEKSQALQLDELLISKATLNVIVKTPVAEETFTETVPDIKLSNLGVNEQGVEASQVVALVMNSLDRSVQTIATKRLIDVNGVIDTSVDSVKEKLKSFGNDLRKLF